MRQSITLAAVLAASCTGGQHLVGPTAFPPTFVHRPYPFVVHDSAGAAVAHPFIGGFNVPRPQFADIDGDGDPDLFIQELTNRIKYFENTGTVSAPRFTWRTNKFQDLEVGEWYRIVDIDSDGDMDIVGEMLYSAVRLFRNMGSPTNPQFIADTDSLRDANGVPLFSDRQNIPHFVDLDCDDLLDMFVGRIDGTVRRYESVGMDDRGLPRFELVAERFEDIEIVAQFGTLHGANTLTFHDVDGDSDPDLFWGDFLSRACC